MSTNKKKMRLLAVCASLVLLFTSACGLGHTITRTEEFALAAQGDGIMVTLQDGDFEQVYGKMSNEAQRAMNIAHRLVGNPHDLESLIMQDASSITGWTFDSARIFIHHGTIRGELDGKVAYTGGESGRVRLELEQQDGVWKLRSFSLE